MMRIVVLLVIVAAVAYFGRTLPLRTFLAVLLGAMMLYTVLKLTGVIDAAFPDRVGVF